MNRRLHRSRHPETQRLQHFAEEKPVRYVACNKANDWIGYTYTDKPCP